MSMMIPNRIHVSITKARMNREAKARVLSCKRSLAKSSSKTSRSSSATGAKNSSAVRKGSSSTSTRLGNQSATQSLLNNLFGQSSTTAAEQLAENRTKQMLYTRMETAARMTAQSADNLLKTGEDSIFGQDDEAQMKTEAVAEVKNFVNNYNLMLGRLNSSGENTDTAYSKKLSAYVTGSAKALEKIGITAGSSGILSLDEKKLKGAETADIKAVFHGKDSFGEKVGKQAENIRDMAEEKVTALEKNSYYSSANYTRYGTSVTGYDTGSYHSKA